MIRLEPFLRRQLKINVADSRSGEILSLEDLMIGEFNCSAQDAQTWLLDSCTTFHVTLNMEWFSNHSARLSSTIRLGNGQDYKIARTGEVPIQLPNGNTITLHQVKHVPALKRILVSIGMLAEDRYRTTLNELAWIINRGVK